MAEESRRFDVVIAGGGPAGMAAALWCDELGLTSCVLEKRGSLGGQLAWIHNPIRNYPGADFADGGECLRGFESSLTNRRFDVYLNAAILSICVERSEVVTSLGAFSAKAIIVATGIRRRELGVPGEVEFRGRGILESGSRDRHEASGLDVAVIGGGDAALENALILSEFANKVYLIHRRDEFSARDEFVQSVASTTKIEPVLQAEVERFGGDYELAFVDVLDREASSLRLAVSRAVVRVGVVPNSEVLRPIADLDDAGYVKVDHLGRTSVNGIFAIGDVASPVSPTISTATGSAATAVKAIAKSRREFE